LGGLGWGRIAICYLHFAICSFSGALLLIDAVLVSFSVSFLCVSLGYVGKCQYLGGVQSATPERINEPILM
jgi:hypothetical protein